MYLKSLHHYNFRHDQENPKVLSLVQYTPENLEPRMCFKVQYVSDGTIDYIPFKAISNGEWEVLV
ncbi:hypothetical protein ADM98_11555 [Exiguobacterium sp. BMC-KP]|uniref:hypothetical protein n=1 Tax=Exiguobacterium sp. BMC-KP TaxID=1684312 RepID=UPI0006AA58E2|nr:hypothetical protein [Exiguobacterium sp. BMC-KP]KOP29499.1 hypothetical protein ADM98_11555 [Exiguobacterium sp. BMC-KP]